MYGEFCLLHWLSSKNDDNPSLFNSFNVISDESFLIEVLISLLMKKDSKEKSGNIKITRKKVYFLQLYLSDIRSYFKK